MLLMVTSGAVVPGDDLVVATIGFLARGAVVTRSGLRRSPTWR
jgi:hypothetical protein